MSLDNPRAGFSSAVDYSVPGLPWCTSSLAPASGTPLRLDFPCVTRSIDVVNKSAAYISLGFTRNGILGNNKYPIPPSGSVHLDVRVSAVYLQSEDATPRAFGLFAGLTAIGSTMMPLLSGTLADGTPGWQGVG